MNSLKGYKTVTVNLLTVAAIALTAITKGSSNLDPKYLAIAITVLGFVNLALRFVTDTAIFTNGQPETPATPPTPPAQ